MPINRRAARQISLMQHTIAQSCLQTLAVCIQCLFKYKEKRDELINDYFLSLSKTKNNTHWLGATPREYCVQTNLHSSSDYSENRFEKCDICDTNNKDHPADYMIDYRNDVGLTWWQSDTIEYDIQYPNSVNITIHLGNSFNSYFYIS